MNVALNDITGSIPSTIGQLGLCTTLYFGANRLSGTIPDEIGDLASLKWLYLDDNRLNGTLPASLGNLSQALDLRFTLNNLTGTLPSELGNLPSLQLLYLGRNHFRGTIPQSFSQLVGLSELYLYENQLTGTISTDLIALSALSLLDVSYNYLSGPLPADWSGQTHLTAVEVTANYLTGTIPASLLQLSEIYYLRLSINSFTGTVPNIFTAGDAMQTLELSTNKLTGTIPLSLTNLNALSILLLLENYFTGTIPAELGSLETLTELEVNENALTGTIPASLGQLRSATNLYLHTNFLHGTLPPELGGLSLMLYLYLESNLLSGTLPHTLTQMPYLVTFLCQDNLLTGQLEGVFDGALQQDLGLIKLSNNKLTGPLPRSLFYLRSLVTIFLDGNGLTGGLEVALDATAQPFLNMIDFSNNQLTGTIPDELFALPALKTVVLGSNCFSGSLPLSACASPALSTLSLDGLRSASSCQRVMLPGLSSAYVLTDKIHGGVPACLLQMPTLFALHLSGNGLTGSLPDHVNISDTLLELALTHNKLTGTIPRQYQQHIWYDLDLSYNKFTGVLVTDFASTGGNFSAVHDFASLPVGNVTGLVEYTFAALSLRNNRLSSAIPAAIAGMIDVSVLSGNLFSCTLDGSDLPAHDSGRETYQCGSALFNISYYVWLATLFAVAVVAFALYYWRQWFESIIGGVFIAITYLTRWLTITHWYDQDIRSGDHPLQHFKYVMEVSDAVCAVSLWSTAIIVVVFLPLYAALSSQYGTHTFKYAYTVSAAFLSGDVAGALMLVFFLLFVAALTGLLKTKLRSCTFAGQLLPQSTAVLESNRPSKVRIRRSQRVAIYAAFFLINFSVVVGANIAYLYVVLFEDSAYNVFAQIALSVFKLMWNNVGAVHLIRWTQHKLASSSGQQGTAHRHTGFFAIHVFIALFNFVAVPCLVVGLINSNCFNNLLVDAPPVHTTFLYEDCAVFTTTLGCVASIIKTSTTSYSPPFTYSYQCSSSLITYYAPSFVYMALIVTFVNPALDVLMQQAHHRRTRGTWLAGKLDYWVPLIVQDVAAEEGAEKKAYGVLNPYFDANQLLITVVAYLGVLLTFGLVFPPIAVSMLVSIYAAVYTGKIEVGRFLTNAIDQNLHKYLDVVESECLGVGTVVKLRQTALMLLTCMCFFYAPFLFDTLGDGAGSSGAAWTAVAILTLLPATVAAAVRIKGRIAAAVRQYNARTESHAVELQDVAQGPISPKQDIDPGVEAELEETHNALHP